MGRGNESLFTGFWSHDQDGSHAHICLNVQKNLLLKNLCSDFHETWTPTQHSLF